ncbi:MAG: hypothetical protein J7K83_03450 [Candidatus Aenigmarchaeota archaeon]|nr:hypothetical protein [Candidatus Aenigmarchaeota archaeon]
MLFSKKKSTSVGKGFVPTDKVKELFSKGFSEVEIIDILRKEGFSPEEVDKALTEALKSEINKVKLPTKKDIEESVKEEAKPSQPLTQQPDQQTQPVQQATQQIQQPQSVQPVNPVQQEVAEEEYAYVTPEEYVEYLIREKMQDLNTRLMEFNMKYKELENRIADLTERLDNFWKSREDEYQSILRRIETLKDSLDEMNTRIATLERAFKETFPSLIEGIKLLSEVVQKLKKEA